MTTSEDELLEGVAGDLHVLERFDLHRQREDLLAALKRIRDALDSADPTSPVVQWLLLEHQVGARALAATGLNKTATNLPRVWRQWAKRTRQRVAECQATAGHPQELAEWTDQAREYIQDSLKLIRDLA